MRKLKAKWFHGVQEQDKQERRDFVLQNDKAWELLIKILERELADVRDAQESRSLYDNPNWPYMQADYIARARTLREVIDLLTIEEEK